MTGNEILRRLEKLEEQAHDVTNRLEKLAHNIEQLNRHPHSEVDSFIEDLSHVWSMVIQLFPDAILKFDGAIALAGVAGTGDIGPGNVQYPNHSPSTGDPLELSVNRRTRMFGEEPLK